MLDSKYWNGAIDWQKHNEERSQVLAQVKSTLRKVLAEYRSGTLLDIGCGLGIYFEIYDELNLTVKGIDFSLARVDMAQKSIQTHGYKEIEVKLGDIFTEPLKGHYDCVLLSYVLQHLEPPRAKELIARIKDLTKIYVVVGYYSEPFDTLLQKYLALCGKFSVKPFTFDTSKLFNTIPYDYPALFKMPYVLYTFPGDNSLLVFKEENSKRALV